jgi:site-specific DNA recombinase
VTKRAFRAGRKDRLRDDSKAIPKSGAVVYCRVSTKDQLQNFSIETQERACREYCARNGYSVIGVFQEAASAKTAERPRFQAMLTFCAQNRRTVGAVVVYGISRFSRSIRDHHNVRAELRSHDIRLLSVTEPFDDRTAMGKFLENFLSAGAQWDNDQRSERTISGMSAALKAGKWTHRAPVGYVNSSDPGGLSFDSKRAELVRLGFQMFADGAHSKAAVLRHVTTLGLDNPQTGRSISGQTWDKMLRNPLYAGWITSSWGITVRGAFPALITDELFQRVETRLLGKRATRPIRSRENESFPLRVFVRCEGCGKGISGSFSTGRGGRKYAHYACRTEGCRKVKFRQQLLHDHFLSALNSLFPDDRYRSLFREVVLAVWREKRAGEIERQEIARRRVADLKTRKQRLVDLLVEGRIDQQTYEEQISTVGTALGEAESAVADSGVG